MAEREEVLALQEAEENGADTRAFWTITVTTVTAFWSTASSKC